MKNLIALAAASLISFTAHAATLDFTSNSVLGSLTKVTDNEFTGTIGTVGFTLTSAPTKLNPFTIYDGIDGTGCAPDAPGLACDRDGIGIGGGEVDLTETLTLTFDHKVYLSELFFLDLYVNPDEPKSAERASISLDGASPIFAGAVEAPTTGGFKALSLNDLVVQEIVFTAPSGNAFVDDSNNNYALAALNVSPVPVPAAAFLFAPALMGFIGLRRKAKKA